MIAVLLVPAAAEAQDVGQFPRDTSQEFQSDLSARMGRCLVGRSRKEAIAMVMADDQESYRRAYKNSEQDMIGCLNRRPSATLNDLQTRGAMAEALLRSDGGEMLGRAAALAPVAPLRVTGESAAAVVACATGADPADASALLREPAESRAEMAAFQHMASSLQACAPATGAVSLKRQYVRAMTAVSLYRHVTAGGVH